MEQLAAFFLMYGGGESAYVSGNYFEGALFEYPYRNFLVRY